MNTVRQQYPLPDDLRVFLVVVRKGSFVAAADELGQSPAYVSKRISLLEKTLGCRLLHRTTRVVALTEDGERLQRSALQVLDDMDSLLDQLNQNRLSPRGSLHICASFGFGRQHLAPALAALQSQYPELEVRLDVFDRHVDLVSEGFDLEIRVGDDLPERYISKQLLANQRLLVAAPAYLARHGTPQKLADLANHQCLVLKERNVSFGHWQLDSSSGRKDVKISGALSSSNGEIILQWALAGKGIALRSSWDLAPYLASGELVQLLPGYSQSANVWAVYPTRLSHSAKLRCAVEFLQQYFAG